MSIAPVVRRATIAIDTPAEHAEGPMWDARDDTLVWIDQYRGLVRRAILTLDGGVTELPPLDLGMPIGAIVPARSGYIVAAGSGFHRLLPDGTLATICDVLPSSGPKRRMNDGKCDASGRFWAGSMAFSKEPGAGSLYRLDSGRVTTVLTGLTISNGLAWTPDGGTMYFIDTPTQTVQRFTVTASGVDGGDVVVRIPVAQGAPDGMCIDAEGNLWVALWGGGAVQRYSPDGRLLERVEVDAAQVSSCCFGGRDGSTLYITTSGEGYGADDFARDPHAGKVFAVQTGTRGAPAAAYAD